MAAPHSTIGVHWLNDAQCMSCCCVHIQPRSLRQGLQLPAHLGRRLCYSLSRRGCCTQKKAWTCILMRFTSTGPVSSR